MTLMPRLLLRRDSESVQRYFETEDLKKDLGRRTARGGAYTLGATGINIVVTTITTIYLTRALTPEDFGLVGMVTVVTGFASMFVDLGLSQAVIQKPKINHAQVSTLFWINLLVASFLAGLVALSTPLVVAFYQEPRLAPIILSMSGLFVLSALGLQHKALLARRMEFARINAVASVTPILASFTAVMVAAFGGGYWALVVLMTGGAIFNGLALWLICPWRPGLPRRNSGVRQMLAFGGHITGFQFINYFARNADNAMLGFAWGAGALGFYTRAYSLMMLPNSKLTGPLSSVIVPTLSRLQSDSDRFRNAYCRATSILCLVTTIPSVLLVLISQEAIPGVLGRKWDEIVPIFIALSPAVVVACTNSASNWLYASIGHVSRQTIAGAYNAIFMVAAMAIGVQYGVIGLAVSISVSRTIGKIPYVAVSCAGTPVRLGDYLSSIAWITLIFCFSLVATNLLFSLFGIGIFGIKPDVSWIWQASPLSGFDLALAAAMKLLLWTAMSVGLFVAIRPARRQFVSIIKEGKALIRK